MTKQLHRCRLQRGTTALAFLSVVACAEGPAVPAAASDDAKMTAVTDTLVAARERLHKRNRLDWVGLAHNRAIDDFRKEMRKPGVLTTNWCGYIAEYSAAPGRVPEERRRQGQPDALTVRRYLDTTPFCAPRASRARTASWGPAAMQTEDISEQAKSAAAEVDAVLAAATSTYDVAVGLNAVLDRYTTLPPLEFEALSAAIAVTQNSAEYWEQHYESTLNEFIAEYSSCAQDFSTLSDEEIIQACIYGETRATSLPGLRAPIVSFAAAPMRCTDGGTSMGSQGLDAVEADWKGAWAGAVGGIFKAAIGVGALALGGSASIGSLAGSAFKIWRCLVFGTPMT